MSTERGGKYLYGLSPYHESIQKHCPSVALRAQGARLRGRARPRMPGGTTKLIGGLSTAVWVLLTTDERAGHREAREEERTPRIHTW